MDSPLPGANLLALAIIHKAAKAPTEAALLSTLSDVVEALVRRWLESPDVGVGERAAKVLGDLLETDCEAIRPTEGVNGASSYDFSGLSTTTRRRIPGHGRLWRVIFTQRPFLELIKTLCSPETANPPTRPRHQTSLSQGRLLRLLTRLSALDIRAISTVHHQDLFPLSTTAIAPSDQGILQWAALEMLSGSGDILMHLNLIDFFETFVSVMRVSRLAPEENAIVKKLVKVASERDDQLQEALRGLPNRTVEEEAESLRAYVNDLLN